jgi:hypothetical protein
MVRGGSRVSKGISAQASHRTVLAPLNAHGSSCSKNSKHYSLILLNSILFCIRRIVFVSSNKQAKPFALFCFHKMSSLLRFSPQLFYASPIFNGIESRLKVRKLYAHRNNSNPKFHTKACIKFLPT